MTDLTIHLEMQDAPDAAPLIVLAARTELSPIHVEVNAQGFDPNPEGAYAVAEAMMDTARALMANINPNDIADTPTRDRLLRARQESSFEETVRLRTGAPRTGFSLGTAPGYMTREELHVQRVRHLGRPEAEALRARDEAKEALRADDPDPAIAPRRPRFNPK